METDIKIEARFNQNRSGSGADDGSAKEVRREPMNTGINRRG